jgi:hypothetical protein
MRVFNWGLPGLAALVVLASLAMGAVPDGSQQELTGAPVTGTPAPVATPEPPPPVEPTPQPEPPAPPVPTPKPKPVLTKCDANIRIKDATTSCGFAQNVFYGYWLNGFQPGVFADEPGIPAYSPAAGTTFSVNCTGVERIVCRAGDGGFVTFPMAAVIAYTPADAMDHAATHEIGDVPLPDASPTTEPAPDESSDECHPDYGGCLDADSSDYDCEGGSGDGPDYTGRVEVLGGDPYDLDRDGDGVACDV